MPVDGLLACAADHVAENDSNDDYVVCDSDHRDEVGYQIDWHQEVRQQDYQPHPRQERESWVDRQPANQPQNVGHQAKRSNKRDGLTLPTSEPCNNANQYQPQQQDAAGCTEGYRPNRIHDPYLVTFTVVEMVR
jgi:hypothetical protein